MLIALTSLLQVGHPTEGACVEPLHLRADWPDTNFWITIGGEVPASDQRVMLMTSSNLTHWETTVVLHASSAFRFLDPASATRHRRFYRARFGPLSPSDDWKNQVSYPEDSFMNFTGSTLGWIKFVIRLDDPTRVYYAKHTFPFHYEFVTARLESHLGISSAEFDRISLFNPNRELLLGSVLYPGSSYVGEYGIQFVSDDPLEPALVSRMFELVQSTVVPEGPAEAFYMPTFEQATVTQTNQDYFAAAGIPLGGPERWIGNDISYTGGWALGTLKHFPVDEVEEAYGDGRLRPEDVLVVDGVPAELPYVAGIITLTPTTPNSHVAILARSYGVPFGYFVQAEDRARILQWVGQEIVFQTCPEEQGLGCRILIATVDPSMTATDRQALVQLNAPPPLVLQAKQRFGAYTTLTDALTPADIVFFGGKASNFGLLRRVIPSNSPPAIAISFDLWDDFMDQTLFGNTTMRQDIEQRLGGLNYPEDLGTIQTQLAAIQTLIRNGTSFTTAQEAAIIDALSVFDSSRKIRFRSSTNVEDAESFTGAGLYDSYSGCLDDDLDGDNVGPSHCDPLEQNERGVFRALRRVYASFFNRNAYLERRRLGVNEEEVGMAVLVHHSTPDEVELANGVATVSWYPRFHTVGGDLVTQLGAVSVTNPDGSALPEIVEFGTSQDGTTSPFLIQGSSLVRVGETVLTWDRDYLDLGGFIYQVVAGYAAMFPEKDGIDLDLEYKKVAPGELSIKQVRELPRDEDEITAPFVINDPVPLLSWHGFYDDLWMAHRIKSRWTLRHRNTFFGLTNLQDAFYQSVQIEHLNGISHATTEGPPSEFPNASRDIVATSTMHPWRALTRDRWSMNTLAGPADFELQTAIPSLTTDRKPFVKLAWEGDDALQLNVHFHEPQLTINVDGEIDYRSDTESKLYPARAEDPVADFLREKVYDFHDQGTNVIIGVSYWLPLEARGDDCRCPIVRMVETSIEGFTTEPIILRGFWSQTYGDSHRVDAEEFLFEPRLEEGLPVSQRDELTQADIVQIYANARGMLFVVGGEGSPRRLAN